MVSNESLLAYFRRMILAEALVVGVVLLICWLGGWISPFHLGNGLTIAGILVLVMNLYDDKGKVEKRREDRSGTSLERAPTRRGPARRTYLLEILPLGLATLAAGIVLTSLA